MGTAFLIIAIAALVMTLVHAARKEWVPLWVPMILICLLELLRALPLGS